MGMTDKQFASYQKSLLRDLKRAQEELKAKGASSDNLDEVINDIEDELKRP